MTANRQVEERFQESYDLLHAIIEGIPDAVYAKDAAGRYVMVNTACAEVLCREVSDIIGRTDGELFAPEAARQITEIDRRVKATGQTITLEQTVKVKNQLRTFTTSKGTYGRQGKVRGTFGISRDITALKEVEEELRQFSGRLLQLQDEERRRIARELHDSAGQNLSALGVNLARLKQHLRMRKGPAAEALRESLSLVEQCSREMRTLSHLLHPPMMDDLGFGSALRWLVKGFSKRSGVRVRLALPKKLGSLSKNLELTLFRIVQEALTNIHRHSGSKTASVRVTCRSRQLTLEIRDWGKGLSNEVFDPHGKVKAIVGVGISGMRERVRQLGGVLKITTAHPGCMVEVSLPLT